ncbi:MAG: NUDIX hydrolase [Candidatus Nanohaloarchaea archaeon]|nr:NUDIX hydrolase [Candidatus Nanohaloarchaea archaeon]
MGRDGHRVTADAVIRSAGEIVLIRRGRPPFRGVWALPGGHVETGEQVRDAVRREVAEETGLDVDIAGIVDVYDEPGRDPRGPVISIVYSCTADQEALEAATDADEARWFPVDDLPAELAFDHRQILDDYLSQRN